MSITKELDSHSAPEIEKGQTFLVSSATLAELGVDEEAAKRDKALALLSNHDTEFDPESAEAKRILRKIDCRNLPMVFAVYTLMLMDKSSLSLLQLWGLKKTAILLGTNIPGSDPLFNDIGYLAGEIPATYIMQRLPLANVFSAMCILWGIIVAMHAVCKDFGSLAALRFLLGFLEVYTAPAIIYIIGSWYTRKEQITRLSIWYTYYGFGNIFGSFFAWAINQGSFKWQALFIFYGSLTFTVGMLLFWFLAASPTDARWLTGREKTIALERVRINKTGTEIWRFSLPQLRESFLDPRFYLIFLLLVSTGLPSGGLTVFGPSIIAGFGFNTNQSTLLYVGTGAAAALFVGITCVVAIYTNRTIAGIFTLLVSCLGCIIMLAIPSDNYEARYGVPNCVPFIITLMTAGVGGSTKKFAFGAAYQLGYAAGNIIGPQTYRPQDAPAYYPAKYTMLAFLIFCIILLGGIGLLHKYWNTARDRRQNIDNQNGVVHVKVENEEFADLTDFQLRSFRYPI